jgi:cell division protein ZipA
MDRDTVRLVLILVGVTLMAGIYFWGQFKDPLMSFLKRLIPSRHPHQNEDREGDYQNPDEYFEESVRIITPGTDHRREPLFAGLDDDVDLLDEESDHDEIDFVHTSQTDEPTAAPFLIQVSVIAGPDQFFKGNELKQALLENDLLYGDMGIFHRYNQDLTQTLFSVASLVEPGTFPIDDMEAFECPGIILFFQTARVSDPLETYDDLVNTSRDLAQQLHGIQWDETRQPLSQSKIAHMRNLLKQPINT